MLEDLEKRADEAAELNRLPIEENHE